jgi:RHS repeat-associated protein
MLATKEKSQPGFQLPTAALHPGSSFAISNTATSFAASVYDFCGGPRSSGYFRDSETQLDYAKNRYHQPGMGRFLTPDPYMAQAGGMQDPSDPGSWNQYAYVLGDPINLNDSEGLYACCQRGPGGGDPGPGGPIGWGPGPPNPCIVGAGAHADCGGGGGQTFSARTDAKANKQAQTLLSPILQNFQSSNCNKVLSADLSNYSFSKLASAETSTNFYNGSTDSSWTENQVTGNGSSETLGQAQSGSNGVTIGPSFGGGVVYAVVVANRVLAGTVPLAGDTLLHELLHVITGMNDNQLYSALQNAGLVNPGDGSTSAITAWLSTDCHYTPSRQ